MKRFRWMAILTTAALGFTAAGPFVSEAEAQSKKRRTTTAPVPPPEAPEVKEPIVLSPEGLKFGMDFKEVATIYDKVLDKEYVPLYRKVQPGPAMTALDVELQEKKLAFRRSRVDFGTLPTGIDQTALAGEYGYKNDESLMSFKHGGRTRFFFFFQGKLWKVYDEIQLAEGSEYGASFKDAVAALGTKLGAEGRVRDADPAQGLKLPEADWVDAKTHVRAIDRSYENVVGLVYEERETAKAVAALWKANQTDPNAIDPDILAVTRDGTPEQPTPPANETQQRNKKKRK